METKSHRHQIADRIAEFFIGNNMCSPFGGEVIQASDKRSYHILFSRPRFLDGIVKVYSPAFIQIHVRGGHAPNGDWSAVYQSEDAAMLFLNYIRTYNKELAMTVPTKPNKGKLKTFL